MSFKLSTVTLSMGIFFSFISQVIATEEPLNLTNIEATEVSKHLSTIIEPEPIKRVEPKYPINAAREGREGWTILSFVINKEGNVSDAIVKESSGSKDIDKASLKAVSKWKYKPAFENGKPIQQCVNKVQMDFSMSKNSTQGVSRSFNKKYKIASEALKNKDYQTVEQQLSEMKSSKRMHLSESNFMHLLAANYAKDKKDRGLQLYHLNRVSIKTGASTEKLKLSILYQRFALQVALKHYSGAYRNYKELVKLDSAKPYIAELDKVIANIDAVISGDKDIVLQGNIKKDYWNATLLRNEFSLVNIDGSLHTLDVRCANKRELFTVENNNTWTIPTSWKHCQIYVFGEKNTEFNFIEHPIKKTAKS